METHLLEIYKKEDFKHILSKMKFFFSINYKFDEILFRIFIRLYHGQSIYYNMV